MSIRKYKIINDPVYGFITIDHPLLFKVIEHPYYQRLRRIQQMALASLVYPGAVHTRLHHSLGAYHLMCNALTQLKSKGIPITPEEELGAKLATLLHDIGHGPFSHALENTLMSVVKHEDLSLWIMEYMNNELDGQLQTAIDIFKNTYNKSFLHQLVSGQLDVDRMDYLARDSFFTGVSEGVIGYDRIIKMLTVHNGELVVEEKGLHSVEKFLLSRRIMYWQVYLHKTVLAAEKMLVNIIRRAQQLIDNGVKLPAPSKALQHFLTKKLKKNDIQAALPIFCTLDDVDVMCAIKAWESHTDLILQHLCRGILNRNLYKIDLQNEPFENDILKQKSMEYATKLNVDESDIHYFAFTGEAINTLYNLNEERITILFKDGSTKDISEVNNTLVHKTFANPVKKFYICTLK